MTQQTQEPQKRERLKSPVGECKWAHVHTPKPPYKGEDKEPKYEISVYFQKDDPDWAPFIKDIGARFAAIPEKKDRQGDTIKRHKPIKKEIGDDEKETGRLYVTFKTGTQFKPGVFDKYNQPIPETVKIGNGSKVRVNFTPWPFEGPVGIGLLLYLNAVQVVDLVEYNAQKAEAFGFEAETPPAGAAAAPGAGGPPAPEDDLPF